MSDLISRRALYDKAATLEAQALDYVGKLTERDGEETSVKWRIWSAILIERTAFKHDVYDAPSVQPEPKTGRWLDTYNDGDWHCSECGAIVEKDEQIRHDWQRCYHCGARMGR